MKTAQTSFLDEIIVDNFAGGGGASTGIEMATGRVVNIAINHDPDAIRMHKTNHPYTTHLCENVWDIDPVKECAGRPVGLAWFSPDCKHFSKAKGGKPVDKRIRGLAWIVLRWAALVKPRVIMLENVEEFKTWGPVRRGKPVKSKSGQTFDRWLTQLRTLGYNIEYRELVAADYGAPTIRKRFFLIARCDGKPIIWPEPTHNQNGTDGKKKWRSAAEIIDWTLPSPSIFDSSEEIWHKYGLRAVRPLADATLKRIARGLRKFVFDNPEPFIVKVNHGGDNFRGQSIYEPLQTTTAKLGYSLIAPTLIQYHGEQNQREVRGQYINNPLLTTDSVNRYGLVMAFMSKYFSGGHKGAGNTPNTPLNAVTGIDHNALVTSHMIKLKGGDIGQSLIEPTQTITAGGTHFGEVRAFLTKYYGQGDAQSTAESLHTITGKDTFGLVTVYGVQYAIIDIGLRMLTPRELYNAQGFPPDYIIDRDNDGNKYSKTLQVARCGNAVPPPFAEALVRANFPEWCGDKICTMKQMHDEMAV